MGIENTEMAIVPSKENALAVFTADKGLDPFLLKIREEIDVFTASINSDMSIPANRKKVASMAHKVARSKTALDDAGKELTSQLKEMPRKVDAERKRMRDLLDTWKDEVRAPLTNWELEEEARIKEIQYRIDAIDHLNFVGFVDSDSIKIQIENVKTTVIDDSFCEFRDKAEAVKNKTIVYLQDLLEKSLAHEQAQAERNRIEEENRIEAERKVEIERAEQEAAEKAKKEKEDAERRELELRLEAEKAKREALEAQERAKQAAIEAEERIKKEFEEKKQREQEEIRKREADKTHRAKIKQDIVKDFMEQGFNIDEAQKICACLVDGIISHVEIIY